MHPLVYSTPLEHEYVLPTCRFMQLISLVPTDPGVLQRMGEMYDSDNDRSQAFQYHYEVDIPVTSSRGGGGGEETED